MKKLRIGILGTGVVGQNLGRGFLRLGFEVKMGSRTAQNPTALAWRQSFGSLASIGTFAETAVFADLIVLAVTGTVALAVLDSAGIENFATKIVIDACNPLVTKVGRPELALGFTDSLGEQVQRKIADSRVVKAFNTVGASLMITPKFKEGKPDMFLCGNDAAAKVQVSEFCTEWGWNPLDFGGIESSRLLEPLGMAWVTHGLNTGDWNHAYKFIHCVG